MQDIFWRFCINFEEAHIFLLLKHNMSEYTPNANQLNVTVPASLNAKLNSCVLVPFLFCG